MHTKGGEFGIAAFPAIYEQKRELSQGWCVAGYIAGILCAVVSHPADKYYNNLSSSVYLNPEKYRLAFLVCPSAGCPMSSSCSILCASFSSLHTIQITMK